MSVQLYTHSDYSLLQSALGVQDLVAGARQLGIEYLALTDRHTMAGHQELQHFCLEAGIKPIFGLELDVCSERGSEAAPVVILAATQRGYYNLLQLASLPHPLPKERLLDYKEGLVFLEGGPRGQITRLWLQGQRDKAHRLALWYREQLGPHYYLRYELGQDLALLKEFTTAQFVLTQDVRYLEEGCCRVLEVLGRIGGFEPVVPAFPLLSWEELTGRFSGPPEVVQTTRELALSLECTLLRSEALPPHPGGADLGELVRQGARRRYKTPSDQVWSRLNHELEVITEMGFGDYFLIVADLVDFAKRAQIPVGPGRGSAAGSLVAYCLGITEVDPLRWGLLFERFLNRARQGRPDIDLDFCYERRGEVLNYVLQRFGREHAAQIATYGTFGPNSAAQEVRRALGAADPALSGKIQGLKRHRSTHAAGVVITKEPIQKYTAIYGDRDFPLTQLDMYSLEALGILKIDLLGLRTLTLLRRLEHQVQLRQPDFALATIPTEDQATFALLAEGRSLGLFQLESELFQDLLRAMAPRQFSDLVALLALGRPGPLNIFPEFLARKKHPEQVGYLHPDLEEILGETYGLILYQEQVMLIAHRLATFSLGEADLLRRALGQNDAEAIAKWKKRFMSGAQQQAGLSRENAERLFASIVRFSGYAFNKAHSVSYAKLAWQAAYLKANYPAEFFQIMLEENGAKRPAYLAEARRAGLPILLPSVIVSGAQHSLEGGALRLGLDSTGIPPGAVQALLRNPSRGGWSGLNLSQLRAKIGLGPEQLVGLVLSGALDHLGPRNRLLQDLGAQVLSGLELLRAERKLLGLYVSEHPCTPFQPLVRNLRGELESVMGEFLGWRDGLSGKLGYLDSPAGPVVFEVGGQLAKALPEAGTRLALFGARRGGVWLPQWVLPLGPTLVVTPEVGQLETLKRILLGGGGNWPVVLRLGTPPAFHLLPRQFWIARAEQGEKGLKSAGIVYTWFDPWKEKR